MDKPYKPIITILMDIHSFNNLADKRYWSRAIRACKALSQTPVPEDAKTTVTDWMQHRLAVSTAEGRDLELHVAQAEVLKIVSHFPWPCGWAD